LQDSRNEDAAPARAGRGLLARLPAAGRPEAGAGRDDTAEALLLLNSFESSGQGWFWATDASGRLTYLTDAIARSMVAQGGEILGTAFTDHFVREDDGTGVSRTLPFLMAKRSGFEKLTLRPASTLDERWWVVSGTAHCDAAGNFVGYRGSGVDITEQRRSSEHASQLAMYDPLTGLPNRLFMSKSLEASLQLLRHHDRPCAVLLIDLDRFKQVNDTLGHPAGDALLRQVSERLLNIVGDKEKIFRLGGDEFKIIVSNCEDRGVLGELAQNIIANLSQPYSIEGSRCIIGASIGVAVAPIDGSTSDELSRNVDLALYAAKAGGRGRFRFFSSDLLRVAEDKRLLEMDMRDALANGEFSVFYQPIVNARNNIVTGVEALVRWNHPERGPISPALFIPIAEEAGLIAPLGEWVLRRACEDVAKWPGALRVAVNVSPIQFTNEALPQIVVSALASSGLPANRLELELTEGVFLAESSESDKMFAILKKIGVRLALDDFGTGYSSLGYLKTAPFDKIKIDQSFVRGATAPGSRNGAIIAAIVALAEAVEMETTAEGIESVDQLNLIRNLRVSHVQGFIYSKPIPCDEVVARLESGEWVITPSGPAKQRSDRLSLFRKAGAIIGNLYYPVLVRNISETGSLIEGVFEAPVGTQMIVDFGDGQLSTGVVRRASKRQHGIEFGLPLVSDGNGGLCTSHRVSPYLLGTVGLSTSTYAETMRLGSEENAPSLEQIADKLGLVLPSLGGAQPSGDAGAAKSGWSGNAHRDRRAVPTIEQFSHRYLEHLRKHPRTHDLHQSYLREHVLPKLGRFRLDEVAQSDVAALTAGAVQGGQGLEVAARLQAMFGYMFTLAGRWGVPGAEMNPAQGMALARSETARQPLITSDGLKQLREAVQASRNPQLKHIVTLLLVTSLRPRELLDAKWEDVDLENGVWNIPPEGSGQAAQVPISSAAADVLRELPRWDDCAYLIVNPRTRQPYRSFFRSWDVARRKAGLPNVSIHDLLHVSVGA
jgi:diguanylate cyclase (GGDEF)-like protein